MRRLFHGRGGLPSGRLHPSLGRPCACFPFVAAAIAVYVAYALLAFAWQAHVSGSTSPTIDEVPLVYPRGVMAIGALLLAVQMIARALQNLMSLPPEDAEARRIFGVE